MPSSPRAKCESGIYHVMLRGNGRQIIFENDVDRLRFVDSLSRFRESLTVEIHCYCLMDNHVHILLRSGDDDLVRYVHKIATSYSKYFNIKYDRVGSLFQNPYKSQPVEDDRQYLTVFRYILQNPLKAGISSPELYLWNSYSDLVGYIGITDPSLAIELAGGLHNLLNFVSSANDDVCLDIPEPLTGAKTSEVSEALIQLGVEPSRVKSMPKAQRNGLLRQLRSRGYSIRSIERVTGVSRGVIQHL